MEPRAKRYLWIVAGVVTTLALVNLPEKVDLDNECQPVNVLNQIRASLNGTRYWRSQLALLELEVQQIAAMPVQRTKLEALTSSINAQTDWALDSIYATNPAMGPRPRPSLSDSLRTIEEQLDITRAQNLLHQVMAQRADLLIRCRGTVLNEAQ